MAAVAAEEHPKDHFAVGVVEALVAGAAAEEGVEKEDLPFQILQKGHWQQVELEQVVGPQILGSGRAEEQVVPPFHILRKDHFEEVLQPEVEGVAAEEVLQRVVEHQTKKRDLLEEHLGEHLGEQMG